MQAHFNLGIALQKQGKKDEAIASLKRAVELAETPDEKQHVENALAELEGRAADADRRCAHCGRRRRVRQPRARRAALRPAASAAVRPAEWAALLAAACGGGMRCRLRRRIATFRPTPASEFQHQAEKPLITHPMSARAWSRSNGAVRLRFA